MLNLGKDFACRASSNFLNPRVTLQLYELIHRSYANRFAHSRSLARTGRVTLLFLRSGTGARATVLDLLAAVRDLNHSRLLESLRQGRPTWLASNPSAL